MADDTRQEPDGGQELEPDANGEHAVGEEAQEQDPTTDLEDDSPDPDEEEDGGDLDDEPELDDEDDLGGFGPLRPRTRQGWVNAEVIGRLTVHFPVRDVGFWCDGHTALRAMKTFQTGRPLDDHLHPDESRAHDAWFVLHMGDPLAMSWEPGLPERRHGAAFDPPIPSAA